MPYVKSYGKREEINFLASAKVVSQTYQFDDTGVTADEHGRKIIKAGSVYPANDATAIGLAYKDVDVTEGPQPGAVLIEAWVLEERLPVAPSAAAKTAMVGIKYKKHTA